MLSLRESLIIDIVLLRESVGSSKYIDKDCYDYDVNIGVLGG